MLRRLEELPAAWLAAWARPRNGAPPRPFASFTRS